LALTRLEGSPVEAGSVITIVDARGGHYALAGPQIVCGRDASCDVVLQDTQVSRRHFMLRCGPGGWLIEDLASTNGTWLNGIRLVAGQPQRLCFGDLVTAGTLALTMEPGALPSGYAASAVAPAGVPAPASIAAAAEPAARSGPAEAVRPSAWHWLGSVAAASAAALIAAGALLPWVRVRLQLSPEKALQSALEGVPDAGRWTGLLQSLLDRGKQIVPPQLQAPIQEALQPTDHVIRGLDGYGTFMLVIALIVLIALACDLLLRLQRSGFPGVVYLLGAVLPLALLLNDVVRFNALGAQDLLFGVSLGQLVEGAGRITDVQVTPLTGLYVAAAGCVLLFGAGLARALAPLSFRRPQRG
jgi:hypothetical protein